MAGLISDFQRDRSHGCPIPARIGRGRINNRPTWEACQAFRKNPVGYALTFDEEMVDLVRELIRHNSQGMSLFSYSMMMRDIDRSESIVEMRFHLTRARNRIEVLPAEAIGHIPDTVRALLRHIARRLVVRYGLVGRYRLLFLPFDSNPVDSRRWPVLPWEWLTTGQHGLSHVMESLKNDRPTGVSPRRCVRDRTIHDCLVRIMTPGWGRLIEFMDTQLSLRCDLTPRFGRSRMCLTNPCKTGISTDRIVPTRQLVSMAHGCGAPNATESSPRIALCESVERYQPLSIALGIFRLFFKHDLMESMATHPRFFIHLKGGFNLRFLVEGKFPKSNHRIVTSDLDFVISSHDARWGLQRIIDYWEGRLDEFVGQTPDTRRLFSYRVTKIPNPQEREGLTQIIQIGYAGDDGFIDLSFITAPLPTSTIDPVLSHRLGLPIRKWDVAVYDLFDLVVRENIPHLDRGTFIRRNPLSGKKREKGVCDLYRAATVCEVMRQFPRVPVDNRTGLRRLCSLAGSNLNVARLRQMTPQDRLEYFTRLALHLGYSESQLKKDSK